MSAPVANTVVIHQVDGWWIWTRNAGIEHNTATGGREQVVYSVSSKFPFLDSAAALGNAKAMNADFDDSAFTVIS